MTLRTILVPLNGTNRDGTALEAAVVVAKRFGAHVEALFVAADPQDSALVLGDGMSTAMLDEIIQVAEITRKNRLDRARQSYRTAAVGLPEADEPEPSAAVTLRWREAMGRADRVIAAEGRLFDLTVATGAEPEPESDTDTGGFLNEGLEAALLSTGRPVLVARTPVVQLGRVVAVAWNGALEASRAVAAALPWLREAEQVHVLAVGTSGSLAGAGARLAAYLAWHGIAAAVSPIEPGSDQTGAAILRRAIELDSDLLVMGAYGHSRMREMILGGVTRHILSHSGPAVLMAH